MPSPSLRIAATISLECQLSRVCLFETKILGKFGIEYGRSTKFSMGVMICCGNGRLVELGTCLSTWHERGEEKGPALQVQSPKRHTPTFQLDYSRVFVSFVACRTSSLIEVFSFSSSRSLFGRSEDGDLQRESAEHDYLNPRLRGNSISSSAGSK